MIYIFTAIFCKNKAVATYMYVDCLLFSKWDQWFCLKQHCNFCTYCATVIKGALLTSWHNYFDRINRESIIDVEGEVKSVDQKVQSCSQEDVEISVDKVYMHCSRK